MATVEEKYKQKNPLGIPSFNRKTLTGIVWGVWVFFGYGR
jgi:hypothetical protein